MKNTLVAVCALFLLAGTVTAAVAKAHAEYGQVVINNTSQKDGMAPVVFDHWLHRAQFTCRLCHVDIGFNLKTNATGIHAADNMKGMYCGVCHNGKMQHEGHAVFAACSTDKTDMGRCDRCHSQGKNVKKAYDFASFTAKLPKDKFGNGIDWEKAVEDGALKPVDFIEGVSIKKPAQPIQADFAIQPKAQGKAEIIFSHKKHALWNGCEVCHPEIFAGGKRGTTKYSMDEINHGKFCGVCHKSVSFPLENCERCHSKPVK